MLVAGDVVVTCAHVVEDALKGTGVPIGAGSKTSIDFPFANVMDVPAEVVGWHPVVPELGLRRAVARPIWPCCGLLMPIVSQG